MSARHFSTNIYLSNKIKIIPLYTPDMELNLNIDENGRTLPTSTTTTTTTKQLPAITIDDYSTKSTMFESLNEELCNQLILDCEAITTSDDLPLTFWLSMNDEPRFSLEILAKKIFDIHVNNNSIKDSDFDQNNCGCEWWIQMRPSPNKKRLNSDSREAVNGIQFHWDKDETLRDLSGGRLFIHPHLSTVTYLTSEGAPTMVFEDTTPDEGMLNQDIEEAYISWPRTGKHLSFDGRFLHGAPSDLLASRDDSSMNSDKTRVTFLVNIWLFHQPLGVEPFPSKFLIDDRRIIKDIHLSKARIPKQILNVSSVSSDSISNYTWGLSKAVNISVRLPLDDVRTVGTKSDGSVRIKSTSGIAKLNVLDNE